jgi:L-fucose isomerase
LRYNHLNEGFRLQGSLPKIGIRIIVDGRNDVRDKIEGVLLKQAEQVKKLLEANLYHASGEKVEVILSETPIGGVAEAARVKEQFTKEGVGAVISITRTWAYAAEVIEMDPLIPQAIWGINGSERPGAVYLAGAIATSEQKGLPVFKIYGKDVQDADDYSIPEDVATQMIEFSRAAIAVATMKNKSYLSIGTVCMGIGGSIIIPEMFQDYFGMRNEYVDMTELTRRLNKEIYDKDEFERALKWIKFNCVETKDPNPEEIQESRKKKDKNWETVAKMSLIVKDLMVGNPKLKELGYEEEAEGHNAIVAGFQGQRQWTDYYPNGDFMEAILNSSFDWNGIRQPYIVATENDSLNGMSMLFGHLLTGTAQVFADVRTFWSADAIERVSGTDKLPDTLKNGFIYLTNSGAAALDGCGEMQKNGKPAMLPHWEISSEDVEKSVKATKWGPAKLSTFRGGGFSSSFLTKGGMPMTALRLNYIKGLGPVLQIAEGYSIDLDEKIKKVIVSRTDPTWPKTFFVPKLTGKGAFKDVYTVMKKWGSNHCSFSYRHIGHSLITLASMLRIPVMMHNIDEERIFRPSAWDAFGTDNLEAADYRACRNFGPIYK